MKKVVSLLLYFCSNFILYSQEIKTFWGDQKYMIQKELILNDEHSVFSYYMLSENAPSGYYIIYHSPNFKIKKMEGKWQDGKKEGKWIYYDSKGNIARTITFYNGLAHGEELYYNTRTNEVLLKYTYYGGVKQGEYFVKYANGQLWETGQYKNGLPEGEWKYWDSNGTLKRKRTFINGKLVRQENY